MMIPLKKEEEPPGDITPAIRAAFAAWRAAAAAATMAFDLNVGRTWLIYHNLVKAQRRNVLETTQQLEEEA